MVAVFSRRVAIPRHCLRRLMHRSTVLRCLYVSRSKAGGLPPALSTPPLVGPLRDPRADAASAQVVPGRVGRVRAVGETRPGLVRGRS